MIWTRLAKGVDAIACLALSWMVPCYNIAACPGTNASWVVDGKADRVLGARRNPGGPILPPLLQM
jgi:hypothetical protein